MDAAREALQSLNSVDAPLKSVSELALLCVRAELPQLAAQFLWRSVHEVSSPNPEDLYAYASALRKLGLTNQSLKLSSQLESHPQVLLHLAFCHISRWEYSKAADYLKKNLKITEPGSKSHGLTAVNLVGAYVFLWKFDEAQKMIHRVKEHCRTNFKQLYLNLLELQAQIYLHSEQLEKARLTIEASQELHSGQQSSTDLYLTKWKLLVDLKDQKIEPTHPEISEFLKTIRNLGHWESVRDWDFQVSRILNDNFRLVHNYFGTPFPEFRKRILRLTTDFSLPEEYLWFDPRSPAEMKHVMDTHFPSPSLKIPFGKSCHRLLMLLSSDFYRPWSVDRIFDSLFIDESFDPFSSSKRVYKHMDELKSILNDLPLELKSTPHGYRLRPSSGGCLIVKDQLQFASSGEFICHLIQERFKDQAFSKDELTHILPLSPHQILRQLSRLVSEKVLETKGSGRGTKYVLKDV